MDCLRSLACCTAITSCMALLIGCDADVPRAQVVEPVLLPAGATLDATKVEESLRTGPTKRGPVPAHISIDPKASRISFVGAKVTGKHDGGFDEFDGKLKLGTDGDLEMVQFTVYTGSVYSDHEKLTQHLKSSDFFDTARFPVARFESTAITAGSEARTAGGKAYTHTIVGNMTIRGITRSLTIPAMVDTSGDTVSASSDFVFDRHIFGIMYDGRADDLIRPSIEMHIEFQA